MKSVIITVLAALFVATATAADLKTSAIPDSPGPAAATMAADKEPAALEARGDSIERAVSLNEVTVEAPRVVRKPGMDVYYPSKSAVENSVNGMGLLTNLMIPTVIVNDMMNTIRSAGADIQIRINGRKATVEEVRQLVPSTIKRVEWHDNPGLRYNGATSVLDFIVANPTSGGSFTANVQPAVNCNWGNYDMLLRFNRGRSQFGIGGWGRSCDDIRMYRDYSETFTLPDGTRLSRREETLDGKQFGAAISPKIVYNYTIPDKTYLYATAVFRKNWPEGHQSRSKMTTSDGSPDIALFERNSSDRFSPRFNLYLEQHLERRQTLAVDANLWLNNGKSEHIYTEELYSSSRAPLADVHTLIFNHNIAYGLEADYFKEWSAGRLNTGASYVANRNRSTYENLDGAIFHQNQDKAYIFAEYTHRIGRLNFTAGMGAQYTRVHLVESDRGTATWSWRPQVSVRYRLDDHSQVGINFARWPDVPSLDQTNSTPQQLDGIQWQVGNPDLKIFSNNRLRAQYRFTFPRVEGTFFAEYNWCEHPILPYLYWQDDRLITTYSNNGDFREFVLTLAPQITIIPEWLTFSGDITFKRQFTRGLEFRHIRSFWMGNATLQLTHWNFTLTAQYVSGWRTLWGEEITKGETLGRLSLAYRWKDFEFSAGTMAPFIKYKFGTEYLNKYLTRNNTSHSTTIESWVYVKVGYTVQWGNQGKSSQKLINVDGDIQQTSASGR